MKLDGVALAAGLWGVLIVGCGRDTLTPADYVHWVEDPSNGLVSNKTVDGWQFELQYHPIPYVVIRELGAKRLSPQQYRDREKQLSGLQYFQLTISPASVEHSLMSFGIRDDVHLQQRLNYFAFGMQADLWLDQNGTRLPCRLYHFERTFGLTPFARFLLAFEEADPLGAAPRTLTLDTTHFGTGPVQLSPSPRALTSIPKLELES